MKYFPRNFGIAQSEETWEERIKTNWERLKDKLKLKIKGHVLLYAGVSVLTM